MAKKLTSEELRQQADELRKRAKDAMKEAKRIERKEERERIALAKKREREEWLSLMEVGKVGTITVTDNGQRVPITVIEYLRRLKKEQEEERAKKESEQQEQTQNPNEQV